MEPEYWNERAGVGRTKFVECQVVTVMMWVVMHGLPVVAEASLVLGGLRTKTEKSLDVGKLFLFAQSLTEIRKLL